LTGISLALAILVTPSALLALPCFTLLRPDRRSLSRLYWTILAILAIAIIPHYRDYFFGNRGLITAATSPMNIVSAAIKEGYEVIFGLFLYVPFMLVGFVQMLKDRKLRIFSAFVICFWLFNFLFGERFSDVPTQLPLYAILCVISGLGVQACTIDSVRQSSEKKSNCIWILGVFPLLMISLFAVILKIGRTPIQVPLTNLSLMLPFIFAIIIISYTLIIILSTRMAIITRTNVPSLIYGYLFLFLTMNSVVSFTLVSTLGQNLAEYRQATLKAHEVGDPNYLVIGDWSQGILYEHYVFHEFNTEHWINTECLLTDLWGEDKHEESMTKWRNSLNAGREIFLLGDFPTLLTDLQEAGYSIEPFGAIHRAQLNANAAPSH
jgi:hypothetical protein